MPSRGSPIVKSKPNVEKANGITAEAHTLKRADRNPGNITAFPELDANANAVHVSGLIND